MKQIGAGAEAILYRKREVVLKDRVKKGYRIKEIDERLRKSRTRREAKILEKLAAIKFPAPRLVESDDKKMHIKMDFVDGVKLRDVLDEKNCVKLCKQLGKKIAILHRNGVVHADLTTSNMIVKNNIAMKDEIYFIDFGLSFFSSKIEDKAVDLHLLRQALESKHHTIYEKCFQAAIEGYKKESRESTKVLERLEKVEKRGRYKSS